jgi:hypothetical protein
MPSAAPWYTYTDSIWVGGFWEAGGLACLDNGDVYSINTHSYDTLLADWWDASYYIINKRRADNQWERLNPPGHWAHPWYREFAGGSDLDSQTGYLPHISLPRQSGFFQGSLYTDGTQLYLVAASEGKLFHIDPDTLQVTQLIGTAPEVVSHPGLTVAGTGAASLMGGYPAQPIKIGNHLYWLDYLAIGDPTITLNQIIRMSLDPPYGTEYVSPVRWKSVPGWASVETDAARLDSNGVPNGHDVGRVVNAAGTTCGLAYYEGYFYFTSVVGWNFSDAPEWADTNKGGWCALRRWKWPDSETGNDADIETLYYSWRRGVLTDHASQPEGSAYLGRDDDFFRDGLGDEMLEGFEVLSSDLHVIDGWLYMHNWATVTQPGSPNYRSGAAIIRFDVAQLVADVEANGGPLLHDRENPYFETVNQASGWWLGRGDYVWSVRDRWQNYRDGDDPINHGGYGIFVPGKGPDFADKILMLNTEFDNSYMNMQNMYVLRVLSPTGPPTTFDVTLSFEGVRLKGYQRQTDIPDLFVPEIVTLS